MFTIYSNIQYASSKIFFSMQLKDIPWPFKKKKKSRSELNKPRPPIMQTSNSSGVISKPCKFIVHHIHAKH